MKEASCQINTSFSSQLIKWNLMLQCCMWSSRKINWMMQWTVYIYKVNACNEAEPLESLLVREQKMLEDNESTGCKITYKCNKCWTWKVCKQHSADESISVKEEVEQDGTKKSVKVDVASPRTTASLQLMNNSSGKLAHNKERTLKVCNQQTKELNQLKDDKKMYLRQKKNWKVMALLIM